MKILHVEAGRNLYGGPRQVLYLLDGLRARGIQNVLVCPRDSAIAAAAFSVGHTVRAIPMHGDYDVGLIWRLKHLIAVENPDLVHLHSRRGADLFGGLAARWSGVPAVLTRRVLSGERPSLMRVKYRPYAKVIAISEAIHQVLLRQGLPAERLAVVRSAIDEREYRSPCDRGDFRRAFGLTPSQLVIGVVAQLIDIKGHRFLLQALPALLKDSPDTRVLFFGKGPLWGSLRRQVRRLGLRGRVILAGHRSDLQHYLGCLDLLVHPALKEGLGVSLLEASSAGVPIVASRVGGIPEVVRDGETGLLVSPGDAAGLASAVGRLLADAQQRRAMGARGRELMASEFSIDAMTEGNLAVYREVLGESPSVEA